MRIHAQLTPNCSLTSEPFSYCDHARRGKPLNAVNCSRDHFKICANTAIHRSMLLPILYTKADFVKQELHKNNSNPKKFWCTIETLIPKKNKAAKLTLTNGLDIPPEETAKHINEYFVNIGPNLARAHSNINCTPLPPVTDETFTLNKFSRTTLKQH